MQNKYNIKTHSKSPVLVQMKNDIITCALKPGTQIREAIAVKRYGASRTPVREALVELAANGFVSLEPNKGAIVAPLDAATVFSVFEARIPAEKAAAALAAVRATDQDRQNLKQYKQELEHLDPTNNLNDFDDFFAIDKAVHDALAHFARNDFIANQIEILRAHTARCWHFYKDRGLEEEADVDGVIAVLDAVISNNPEQAAEAMRVHLGGYVSAYRDMLTKHIDTLKWV